MRWTTIFCLITVWGVVGVPVGADDDGRTIWGDNYKSTVRAMKKVKRALGVKSCLHCHIKKDGKMEYEIETENKKIARRMYASFTDTLASAGRAQLEVGHDGKLVQISAVTQKKGEDAGIHLKVAIPAEKEGEAPRTLTRRVDLPADGQPIRCGTCHGGKLHFITEE